MQHSRVTWIERGQRVWNSCDPGAIEANGRSFWRSIILRQIKTRRSRPAMLRVVGGAPHADTDPFAGCTRRLYTLPR
jgi:hypothetical protein